MKRWKILLLFVIGLAMSGAAPLEAQGVSADRFLDCVSSHPVGDQGEKSQAGEVAVALSRAPRSEAERVLPAIIADLSTGKDPSVRAYSTSSFLLMIAIRPDGANLLSSSSVEISSLLVDANPGIQKVAAAITDYVIAKAATKKQPYLSALQTALQNSQTSQDAAVDMIGPLLTFGGSEPATLKSVMAFLQRDDLTPSTRSELIHDMGLQPELPEEINRYLVGRLNDPDPHVRAMALVSWADSTTAYHTLGKDSVARMANDPQEIAGIRKLAKDAIAGKTHLSPNYDLPPLILDPNTGAPVQQPKAQ